MLLFRLYVGGPIAQFVRYDIQHGRFSKSDLVVLTNTLYKDLISNCDGPDVKSVICPFEYAAASFT
jgi:hypothetical protein